MAGILKLVPGEPFAGDFRVREPLLVDGSSAVYVVDQLSAGCQRALELLPGELVAGSLGGVDREAARRFEAEARVGARIESDHVVQVVDAGVDEVSCTPWLAMELLRGEDLASRITTRGPESLSSTREIVGQLCHALAAAHDLSIVHGGLTPSKVFLAVPRREGVPFMVKVLDFGLSRLARETGAVETPRARLFLAPEQTEPGGVASVASDVWTLGLIVYSMLTGRSFWRGAHAVSSVDLVREITFEPLPKASERAGESGVASLLPPGFDAWFERCVARKPSQRFATVREARAAFDAMVAVRLGPSPTAFAQPDTSAHASAAQPPLTSPSQPQPVVTTPGTDHGAPPFVPGGSPFRAPPPGWGLVPATPPKSSGSPVVALVLAAVLILPLVGGGAGFAYWKSSRKKAAIAAAEAHRREAWSDADSPVPVSYRDPTWGARDAPVTLVEFSDFQCPFCARAETTLTLLREKYGPDKLRVVWKNQPLSFHSNAGPAAEAAEVVFERSGSVAFWNFHRLAFQNQKSLARADYVTWATELGLDRASYTAALDAHTGRAKVEDDQRLASKVGASGTPTFFVNGVLLTGAQPREKFEAVIDVELEKAAAKLASGTRRDRVYVELSQASFVAPAKKKETHEREPDDGTTVRNVPVGSSPVLGPAAAPVTIVVFSDYQCPFCKRAELTLKQLRETYGDKVRIVWKDMPLAFHKRAVPAADLALEARKQRGEGGFWKVHDLLMEATALEDADLRRVAGLGGLDVTKAMAAVSDSAHASERDEDGRLVKKLKLSGTPHFFINGRSLRGAQPLESFKRVIEEELVHAEKLTKGGVSPARVYATILATAVDEDSAREDKPTDPLAALKGVVTEDLVVGKGPTALVGDEVSVHYVGTLTDGEEFDSSRTHTKPFEFSLGAGHVIKGWDQGIVGMRVGGKRKLTIAPSAAYGERGAPPKIPPNATLVFVVELVAVKGGH